MAEYELNQVTGFLVDGDNQTRKLLRGILVRMGLAGISEFATVPEAVAAFATNAPDFIFVDADLGEGEGLRFVQGIRHSAYPTNPFVPIVAMTWHPTQPLMVRFTASGADDLMLKPFSTKQVHERLTNLIEARKSFVVTSDYVGPDRRKSPREGVQIPLFDVVNTLRLKATGGYDRTTVSDAIGSSLVAINEQKVIRHGFQVAFLVEFALPGVSKEAPDRQSVDHLLRVPPVVEDLMRRLAPGTEGKAMAETYGRAVLMQIDQFKVDVTMPLQEPSTLRRAAMGLAAMAARRLDLPAVEREVVSAVNAYRARLESISQAKAAQASAS